MSEFRPLPLRPSSLPESSSLSLRWRVMLLAMSMVAMVVVLMALAVYVVVSRALYDDIDNQLQSRARLLIESGSLAADPGKAIEGTAYSDVNAMLVNPGRSIYTANQQGQTLPIGEQEKDVMSGQLLLSLRTADHQRVLAVHLNNGSSLLISKSLAPTGKVLKRLGTVLLIVGGIGVAIAAFAGGMVARAGLRPVARLTEAAERVARTDDLRPIPVLGSDELARLTQAFNMMLRGLAESRERQARLVTDAGHELRTPLTSLRTNVELLIASQQPGAPRIPDDEMVELRADVIAQIEELSTLVGDLVDLTRDEAGGVVHEPVDISEVVDRSLERVRRRRSGVVARHIEPARQRRQVEPRQRPGVGADDADRPGACRARRLRLRPRHSTARTRIGLRTVLPLHVGARHAGLRPRPGHRQASRSEARRGASGGGHPARRAAAGGVDLRAAAGTAYFRDTARRGRTTGGQRRQWVSNGTGSAEKMGMCRTFSKWILSPSGHRGVTELRCRSVGVVPNS